MILYPTLQLLDGRCVTLAEGRLEEPEVWHGDPVARAQDLAAAGARWLHVTDLDAVEGRETSSEIVRDIIRRVGVPVQLAGGMTSDATVQAWRDAGAARIVFGASAVNVLDWVKAKARETPDYFAVSIDVFQGRVMVDGWRRASMFTPSELIAALEGTPLAAIIVTDIDHDLGREDASFALVTRLAEETRTPIIASGLVKTIDDVSRLRFMPNLAGALVGRPLFERSIELGRALEIADTVTGPTPSFI